MDLAEDDARAEELEGVKQSPAVLMSTSLAWRTLSNPTGVPVGHNKSIQINGMYVRVWMSTRLHDNEYAAGVRP
jgi:hypothetical protein